MELYTFEEAAKVLNCSKRSINNYIRKGFITRIFDSSDNKYKVSKPETDTFASEATTSYPGLSKRNFMELERRVKRSEESLAVIKHILGIGEKPIRLDDLSARKFLDACMAARNANQWAVEEIEFWASQLLLFDEVTLESIAKVNTLTAPWVPFFKLSSDMYECAQKLFDSTPSLKHEGALLKIEKAKKNLFSMGLVWTELNKDSSKFLMQLGATNADALSMKLAKRLSS